MLLVVHALPGNVTEPPTAKSTVSGFMQGINPASSMSKFGSGFETGAGMGTEGIPGLQGGHQLVGGKDMGAFAGGIQGGFGNVFKAAPSAVKEAALPKIPEVLSGDVTGDATSTEFPGMNVDAPGLLGPYANPGQSSFSFVAPQSEPEEDYSSLSPQLMRILEEMRNK